MLKVENLSFSYGREGILKDICFSAEPGKITVLIGTNGAGKTTLLNCLTHRLKGGGKIVLDEQDLSGLSFEKRSELISYLEQSTLCDAALNVFEVILLGRMGRLGFRISKENHDAVNQMMRLLHLENLAGRNISELSGGQRQMVFIAQALVREPRLFILDEPVSALDLNHQFHLMDFLKTRTREKGYTTIITLHQLDLAAQYADHLVILHNDQVYREGPPEKILNEGIFHDVYQLNCEIYTDSFGKRHFVPTGSI